MVEKEFYDRKEELELLKEKYAHLKPREMLIVYGRRRVGKTELIRQFLKGISGSKMYFYVDLTSRQGMLDSLSAAVQEQLKETVKFLDFEEFLKFIKERSEKEKLLVIIDEFQRMLDIAPEFITRLQHYWDSRLEKNNLMIILVGSSIGMIQKITNSRAGALYGRGSKLKISPFRYCDFRTMFKELTEEEKVLTYAVFGGTPYYLEKVKKIDGDIHQRIFELTIKKGAELIEEPKNLLEYENVRVHAKYNAILRAVSSGKETVKEIEDITKINAGQMSPYLQKLDLLLDLVGRNDPRLGKERLGRYCLRDNFFKFWYRFIFPHQTTLNLGNTRLVSDMIRQDLNGYVGRIFEDIVRELLTLYNTKEINGLRLNFENIGSWWDRNGNEIDVIAYNLKEKEFLFGEVKWTNKPLDHGVVEELERKARYVKYGGRSKFLFVSKGGFTERAIKRMQELKAVYLDLKDVGRLFDAAAE